MIQNEVIARALSNTGIEALNEMQQAVLDAGTTKDMVLLSPTGSGTASISCGKSPTPAAHC